MSVSGVLGWLNIQGVEAAIDPPEEIYSGLETLITVRLVNKRRYLPSFLLQVNLLGEKAKFDIVERGGEGKSSFTCMFRERGEQFIAGAVISSPFPINFFVRSRRLPFECRVVVFPFPRPAQLPVGRDNRGTSGVLTAVSKGYEGDLAKISDYSGSDPLKLIHWRLSAKHGELKVKELAATSQPPVILDIDRLQGQGREDNLSRAAYLVNWLIKSNRPVGLKIGERTIAPAVSRPHRLLLLTELALHDKY